MALDPTTSRDATAQAQGDTQSDDLPETRAFPYVRIHFDVFFFGAEKEPPKSATSATTN